MKSHVFENNWESRRCGGLVPHTPGLRVRVLTFLRASYSTQYKQLNYPMRIVHPEPACAGRLLAAAADDQGR